MESAEARLLREAGTVVENELNERRNKMALGATLNGRSSTGSWAQSQKHYKIHRPAVPV